MAYTNFLGDGVSVNGAPLIPGGGGIPVSPNIIFVCNRTGAGGSDGGLGTMSSPYATIDYAIGQCTADRGDTIVVLSGHAETLTAAGSIACDVAGINIIGVGTGSDRPTLTFSTAAGASVLITAANVQIANILCISGVDALTQPFDVRAAGCTLGNFANGPIEWQDPSSALQAVRVVLGTSAADKLAINLKVFGIISGGTSPVNAIRLVGTNSAVINCDFYGRASTAFVEFLTTACSNIEVYGYMYNSGVTNSSTTVVDTATGSTWFCSINDGAAGAVSTGGSASPVTGTGVAARVAKKAAAVMTNGLTLFTIANGPIRILALTSICETANDGTASTLQYSATPTSGSAQTISGASASLASAAAGASVTLAGTALATAALLNANGPNLMANPGTIMAPAGTITAVIAVGSTTGTWAHYIRYEPLAAGATVS